MIEQPKDYDATQLADFLPLGYDAVISKMEATLSSKRLAHCRGVEKTAIAIAKRYDQNVTQAGLAGLLHDYAKERRPEEFRDMIRIKQLDRDLLNYGNAVWHGVVGAEFVRDELKVTDPGILQAIRHHTVGSPLMSVLDKIVFVADYVEPGRDFPGVEAARKALATSLDEAVSYELTQTLLFLIKHHRSIYPQTFMTYNALATREDN